MEFEGIAWNRNCLLLCDLQIFPLATNKIPGNTSLVPERNNPP